MSTPRLREIEREFKRLPQLETGETIRRPMPGAAPLSATEREQQRIAYIAAVDAMARALRQSIATLAALKADTGLMIADHGDRLDALERAAAVDRSRTRWQRLRWVVGL